MSSDSCKADARGCRTREIFKNIYMLQLVKIYFVKKIFSNMKTHFAYVYKNLLLFAFKKSKQIIWWRGLSSVLSDFLRKCVTNTKAICKLQFLKHFA